MLEDEVDKVLEDHFSKNRGTHGGVSPQGKSKLNVLTALGVAFLLVSVATIGTWAGFMIQRRPQTLESVIDESEHLPLIAQQMQNLYSKIDLTQFPSGIFLDQGSVLYREQIKQSDGSQQDSPLHLTRSDFIGAYYDLVYSSVREQLPSYTELKEYSQQLIEEQQQTAFTLAVINYDTITDDTYNNFINLDIQNNTNISINKSRLTFKNGYFHAPVNGQPFYETKTFYGASVLLPTVYGPDTEFIIPSELTVTNSPTPLHLEKLQINFPDSGKLMNVDIDVPFVVNQFQSDITGNVKFVLSGFANGNPFVSYGSFCYTPLTMPDYKDMGIIEATIPYNGEKGKISVWIYPSTGTVYGSQGNYQPALKNVMFIVDGFDVKNDRTQETIWQFFGSGMQQFLDMGFDLISIDYYLDNGNTFIQRNGYALREVFKKIPDWMAPGYENRKAVVMSGSMGTQTSRYALRTAEQAYEDHHIGLFVALDGPFQGANIPIGLQGFVTYLADAFGGEAQDLLDGLNSPASSQLLIKNRYGGSWYVPNPAFTQYYSEVGNLGLPQKCRNVAVASGSGYGTRLSSANYVSYGYLDDITEVELWPFKIKAGGSIKTYSDKPGIVFDGWIGVKLECWCPWPICWPGQWKTLLDIAYDDTYSISSSDYIDLAPGGTRTSIQTAVDAFNDFDLQVIEWINNALNWRLPWTWTIQPFETMTYDIPVHNFIPTFSALDIPLSCIGNNYNYAPGNDPNLYSKTTFDNVYFETDNVGHVDETAGNMEFMKNELYGFMATQQSGYLAVNNDGVYKVQSDGYFIKNYPLSTPTQTETITNQNGQIILNSLISGFPGDNDVYCVNSEEDVLCASDITTCIYTHSIFGLKVKPGSLVLGKEMNSGDLTAPGIYGTRGYGYGATNFFYDENHQLHIRGTPWGSVVPGSLIYGDDVIFGVDSSGCICMIRQENGELQYHRILESYTDIVPGSLCYGDDTSGSKTPGLYAVTRSGDIVNYRWINNAWERRSTDWGKAVPGSLIAYPAEKTIYGVSPKGCMCTIGEITNGNLCYYELLPSYTDIVPGSLCAGKGMWASTIPGVYAVTTNGKLVNYRWTTGGCNRREAIEPAGITVGNILPGSLILGEPRIFGVDSEDNLISVKHVNMDLIQFEIWPVTPTPNSPPLAPEIYGDDEGFAYQPLSLGSLVTDPENDMVRYQFCWSWGSQLFEDYSSWMGPFDSGDPQTTTHYWEAPGTYEVRVRAKDIKEAIGPWSGPHIITILSNSPPPAPQIFGDQNGVVNQPLEIGAVVSDPEGHMVRYDFCWDWINQNSFTYSCGPYPSGQQMTTSHSWAVPGTYEVKVRAKDIYEAIGPWSYSHTVTITDPYSQQTSTTTN
ncbi:MAG: hypothetical protein JXA00_02160 [Candidatus Thermoplasmatota archaeon]|nr:hypothetical protein [Candidatus Thermoplasmatota archaeon]